jgi:hypothetical protein
MAAGQVGFGKSPDLQFLNGSSPSMNTMKKGLLPGLSEDRQTHYKLAVPFMSLPMNTSSFSGDPYWMGSVTTQSYNRGKIGRYYYWDMQGNLKGSYLFLDVAGKGKRGLKLVFPRQRTFY